MEEASTCMFEPVMAGDHTVFDHMKWRCVSTVWRDLLDQHTTALWTLNKPCMHLTRSRLNIAMHRYVARVWNDGRRPSDEWVMESARRGDIDMIEWMAGWRHTARFARQAIKGAPRRDLPPIYRALVSLACKDADNRWTVAGRKFVNKMTVSRMLTLVVDGAETGDTLPDDFDSDDYWNERMWAEDAAARNQIYSDSDDY